jgi:hypothetical protein
MPLWSARRHRDDDDALRREVDRLKQENMRLRLQTQRPLSMGKLADEFAELTRSLDVPVESDPSDTVDAAYHVLSSAEATRRAVLGVLESMCTAAAQLRRQLESDLPSSEIDRRVQDRRSAVTPADGKDERRTDSLPDQHSATVTTVAHQDADLFSERAPRAGAAVSGDGPHGTDEPSEPYRHGLVVVAENL